MSGVKPTCYVFALIWTILAICFEARLQAQPVESRLKLQQILVIFPALKALDVGISGLYWSYCPWNGTNDFSRAIDEIQIIIYCITYMLFAGSFYLFSKGWQTVNHQPLKCGQIAVMVLLMVFTWFILNLYFFTVSFPITTLVSLAIAVMYGGLAIYFTSNYLYNMKLVKQYLKDHNPYGEMANSLKLKHYINVYLFAGTTIFCLN